MIELIAFIVTLFQVLFWLAIIILGLAIGVGIFLIPVALVLRIFTR